MKNVEEKMTIGRFAFSLLLFVAWWCMIACCLGARAEDLDEKNAESNSVALAEQTVHFDYESGEKSSELITPEVQAVASAMMGERQARDFLHAMKINMVKYDLDMEKPTGRQNWHGQLIGEEIHTNGLFKIEIYSNKLDGTVWRYKTGFKPVPVSKYYWMTAEQRKAYMSTNSINKRLAAIRAKRLEQINGGTVVTNIETTVGVK